MPLIKSTLKIGDNSPTGHDHITVEGEFVGNLIPNANATYDLGSSTKAWDNLYVASLQTNIPNKHLIYSDGGVLTASVLSQDSGKVSLGITTYSSGGFLIHNASSWPAQGLGSIASYQLVLTGNTLTGRGVGIGLGSLTNVGASITYTDRGTNSIGDLSFYTKESTSSGAAPTLRMIMKYDGKVGIGNSAQPYGKLSVNDYAVNALADETDTTNYHLGLYGSTASSQGIGISFGTVNYVGSAIIHKNSVGTPNAGDLLFYTKDTTTGSLNPQMIIKSNGYVGINVEDPFADLEVEGRVGISNTTNGGELQFQYTLDAGNPFYNYPFNTTELGRIRFGNETYTQASIYGVADENPAWTVNARGTNVVISGTPVGSTTESPIVIFDHTQTTFQSPISVNGTVTATSFIGNAFGLTNIAQGSNTQMQYNDNGSLAGSVVQYEKTTGKVTMGGSGFSAKLLIKDASVNTYTNPKLQSAYHLYISGAAGGQNPSMGIGFGEDGSNVGGAVLFENTNQNNQGELVFLTKGTTSSSGGPEERVRIQSQGIEVKGASGSFGGLLAFHNGTNYPLLNAELGLLTYGSILSTNAGIKGSAASDWNLYNRETELNFYITKSGKTTWFEIATMDEDGLTVSGDVQASNFIGDGSQLTNLPIPPAAGSNYNVQFNDSGSFGGDASFNYYPVTDSLVVGIGTSVYGAGFLAALGTLQPSFAPTDHTRYGFTHTMSNNMGDSCGIGFMSGTNVMNNIIAEMVSSTTSKLIFSSSSNGTLTPILTVEGDRVKTDSLLEVSNPIDGANSPNLQVKGSSVSGEHAGIWLGTTNGTTHAKITANNSSDGTLKIMTRNANSSHDLRMALSSDGINIYENTIFQNAQAQAERFAAIDTGRYPNYLHSNYHVSVQGSATHKAGISFGNNGTAVAWGLVCDNNAYPLTDKRGDLKFTYPQNSTSTTMVDAMTIKGDTGRVGIGLDDPTYNLEVDDHIGIHNTSLVGPQLYLSRDITAYSQMYSGVSMGRVNFGVSGYVNETAAYIVAKGDGTWGSTSRPTRMEFFTRASGSTTLSKKMTLDNGSVDLHVPTNIDGDLNVSNGNIAGSIGSVTCNFVYANQQIYCNFYRANSSNGNAMINIIDYTESGSDRVRVNSTGSAADFCYVDGSDREILYCKSDGWVHIGTTDGEPQYPSFKWIADSLDSNDVSHTSTACYFEGYSAEHMAVFANRHTGTNSDGIAIILGDGITYSTLHEVYSNFPHTTQYYFTAYSKNKHTGNLPDARPDFQGGIRANGSGGISWVASFTGMHASCAKQQPELKVGMIMVSTGEMWYKNSIETALPKTAPTSTPKDKRAYGVVSSLEGSFPNYAKIGGVKEGESQIDINAIGEGCVLVTNIGGNIENGDYICSSEILGYGMLQDDDLLHNYTVAKCTETINWDDPELETIEHNGQVYKIYLAACTYHCG